MMIAESLLSKRPAMMKPLTLALAFLFNLMFSGSDDVDSDVLPGQVETQSLLDYLRDMSKVHNKDDVIVRCNVDDDAIRENTIATPSLPTNLSEKEGRERRISILSCSSSSSLPYYSALEDGFTSEATIEYFSPLEDFSASTDDFFSPNSDPESPRNTPTQMRHFKQTFNFTATIDDVDDLFVPRPSPRDQIDVMDDATACFQITAFDTITSVSERESESSNESDICATPVPEPYNDAIIPPYFEKPLCDVIVRSAEEVVFDCVIIGCPTPDIMWRKDGLPLWGGGQGGSTRYLPTSTRLSEFSHRYTMKVHDVISSDVGEYTVSASNQFGHVTSSAFLQLDTTSEVAAPSFDQIIEDVVSKPYDDVTFIAVVNGGPPLTVTWLKNDVPLHEDHVTADGKFPRYYLTIPCVTSQNVGVYTCRVSNSAGVAVCKAELAVCDDSFDRPLQSPTRYRELYSVIKPLGEGSCGVVKLVQSNRTKEMFAAKYIKRRDEKRAKTEMNILVKLRHENIVKFQEGFSTPNYVIIVMEACQQELFNYFLTITDISERTVSRFVRSLCLALSYLHHREILHLSIEPESLLVSSDQKLKIINFDDAMQVQPHDVVYCDWGSPDFVAPEIVTSMPVTSSTDMWSVGVVTYIACTGVSPFAGVTDQSTLVNIKNQNRKLIPNTSLSSGFHDFVEKLLCYDSEERMTSSVASDHLWLKEPRDVNGSIASEKLNLFQTKRSCQRSRSSAKSVIPRLSISSLLRGEYDSASWGVPRHHFRSTNSDSDVIDDVIKAPAPLVFEKVETMVKENPPSPPGPDSSSFGTSAGSELEALRRREKFSHSRSQSGSMDRPLTIKDPPSLKDASFNRSQEEPSLRRNSGSLRTKMWKKKLSSDGKKVSFEDEQEKSPLTSDVIVPSNDVPAPPLTHNDRQTAAGPDRSKNHEDVRKRRKGNLCWLPHYSDDTSTSSDESYAVQGNSPLPAPSHQGKKQRRSWGRRHSSGAVDDVSNSSKAPRKGILKKGASFPDEDMAPSGKKNRGYAPGRCKWSRFIKSPSLDGSKMFKDLEFDCIPIATRRRLQLRRGASAESALPSSKLMPCGLRGPLFERQRNINHSSKFGDISRQSPLVLKRDVTQFKSASDEPTSPYFMAADESDIK